MGTAETPALSDHDDCAAVADGRQRSNPDEDRIGWENGCWYDDPIAIDQSDGLSEAELQAVVSRTMARVERVRQLEFRHDVPVTIMNRTELREEIETESPNESLRTFDNVKFEALFLINESTDSLKVQERNRGAAILGFYRPGQDELVLVAPDRNQVTISEGTLAHELVHALQDQHFNLSNPRFRGNTRDQVNAIDGIVEGDASYVEHRYMDYRCNDPDHPWNGTCVRQPSGDRTGGSLANIGVYFVKFQPYSDGPAFVAHVKRQGGWSAVNDIYEQPPRSAEQVIHPESYGTDPPRNVTLQDRSSESWTRVRPPNRPDYGTVGQAGIASMFVYPLYDSQGRTQIVDARTWLNYSGENELSQLDPLNYGFDYAEGWDGDRLHVYVNKRDRAAYVWRIVWDSPAEATEFREGYLDVLDYWGAKRLGPNTFVIPAEGGFADAFHISVDGDTVTITNAPSVEQLSEVRSTVTIGTDTTTEDAGSGKDTATPTDGTDAGPTDARTETTASSSGFGVLLAALSVALGVLFLKRF